jgi:hypothetical protein
MPSRTLRDVVAAGSFTTATDLVAFADGLAAAIARLHSSGVVLGAVDPDCVVLDSPGAVRVRPAPASASAWMAPERRGGMDSGIVGDSYLWGACVAYAATGREPLTGSVPLPPSMDPVASLTARALSAAPAIRPTFDEIGRSLRPGSVGGASDSSSRRTLLWAIVGGVVAAAVGIAAVLIFVGGSSSTSNDTSTMPETSAPMPPSPPPTPPSPTPTPTTPSPTPTPIVPPTDGPPPPPGPGVVAPSGTSFLESSSGPVRCAYFPEGTAGQVIACIDDRSDTLVRLNAGMIRVTQVTASQSVQVPQIGVELGPSDPAWLYGTRANGKPLFECWGVPGGIACREQAQGDWFVMTGGELQTS